MSPEAPDNSVSLWRLFLLFWIVLGVLIGIGCVVLIVGVIFGETAALTLAFLIYMAFFVWGFIGDTFSPAQPEVKLPPSVKLRQPLELRNGRYETRVEFDGESWRATLPDDGRPPPSVGEVVSITRRDGLEIRLERAR